MSIDSPSDTKPARMSANTVAPLVTMGTTLVLRKALIAGYESATGKPAPVVHNRDASVTERVVWAATMGAAIALIEIVVWRALDSTTD